MSGRKAPENVFKKRIDPRVKAKAFTNGALKKKRPRALEVPSTNPGGLFRKVLLVIFWVMVIVVIGALVISSMVNDVNIIEYLFGSFYADSSHY